MMRVGLTGNVASGKSTVARLWREAGVPVVSADDLAREAVAPGTPGLARIREAFGDQVLAADGSLDRARMADLVFGDDEARARLEAIVHPVVWALRDGWTEGRRAEGHPLVVAEIPLLFETGRAADFDVVVLVDAPSDVRLERLLRLRDLPEERARALMAAQMDPGAKRARADRVLDNDGDLASLRTSALALLDELRALASEEDAARPTADRTPGMRLDLHLHTWGSWDCLSDPGAVLERAAAGGVDRIAITDHDHIDVALDMAGRYPDAVIPGEEVKTAEGVDVIGLYLSELIPRGTPARDAIERIHAQGGIAYLPHPYARGKGASGRLADELAPLVDVIEVFNARLHPGRLNAPAEALARRHGKLRGGGSDAHTLGEVAGARVEVPRHENTAAGLLRALDAARVDGRTASNLVHLASTWAKVRRRLFGVPHGANPSGV
jgi:dephospho-CoA kinase